MPREVFVAGQILTAAEMNSVSDQTVMVFAGTAARGSAIASPSEGMVTYLEDSDQVQVYDGSSYKPVGGLVDVKSAIFTGAQSASVASGANVAVTDLSITHEVADASNKLIISAFLGSVATSIGDGRAALALHDGTGLIAVGDTAGNRTRTTAGGITAGTTSTSIVSFPSVTLVHTPGAGSKTYTVRVVNSDTGTNTIFVNRTEVDTDAVGRTRTVSSLVIQEVSV